MMDAETPFRLSRHAFISLDIQFCLLNGDDCRLRTVPGRWQTGSLPRRRRQAASHAPTYGLGVRHDERIFSWHGDSSCFGSPN